MMPLPRRLIAYFHYFADIFSGSFFFRFFAAFDA